MRSRGDRRQHDSVVFGVSSGAGGGSLPPAPVLSSPNAGTPTSSGTTNALVTTDQGTGRLYWAVVTNTGSCTTAQLKAGTGGNIVAGSAGNQVVGVSGVQTVASITGLAAATLYQIKFLHTNGGSLDSAQASVDLTTNA